MTYFERRQSVQVVVYSIGFSACGMSIDPTLHSETLQIASLGVAGGCAVVAAATLAYFRDTTVDIQLEQPSNIISTEECTTA